MTEQSLETPAPSMSGEKKEFMAGVVFVDLSADPVGLITSISMLDQIQENLMSATELKRVSQTYFHLPSFSRKIVSNSHQYRYVRYFLDQNGASMTQHSSRRAIMTLATGLYEDAEELNAAIEIVKGIFSEGLKKPNRGNRERPKEDFLRGSGPDKLLHNVAMRFKDVSSKFHGNVGECGQEYVDEYRQVARDYKLTQHQKFDYLHNLLYGDAKHFYIDIIEGYATTFQRAVDMMEGEYNSIVRQTRVNNYLNSFRMSKFEAEGIDEQKSLISSPSLPARCISRM